MCADVTYARFVTSLEELHEVTEELVEADLAVMVLVHIGQERLNILLDLRWVARLLFVLVVLGQDRRHFLGVDGSAVIPVHSIERVPQPLLRLCLAACHGRIADQPVNYQPEITRRIKVQSRIEKLI